MKSVSIAEAKNRLTELLRDVEIGHPVTISRRGKPVAVLIAEAEYERLRSAAVSADFAAWLQNWRTRAGPAFEGISADELLRWSVVE